MWSKWNDHTYCIVICVNMGFSADADIKNETRKRVSDRASIQGENFAEHSQMVMNFRKVFVYELVDNLAYVLKSSSDGVKLFRVVLDSFGHISSPLTVVEMFMMLLVDKVRVYIFRCAISLSDKQR